MNFSYFNALVKKWNIIYFYHARLHSLNNEQLTSLMPRDVVGTKISQDRISILPYGKTTERTKNKTKTLPTKEIRTSKNIIEAGDK
mgnify:CR=1 FL=1